MNTARQITIYIDGNAYDVTPGRHTGAQIRQLLTPPATDLWLDVDDAQDRPVTADAVIALTDQMSFFTSAVITIYLNAQPYRVPAGTLSEPQLRALPTPPIGDEAALFRDIADARDRRLAPGEIVEVHDGDRFFSTRDHHRDVTIIVNATPHRVAAGVITFEAVVALAYPTPPGPNPEYTVAYRKGGPHHPKGTLNEGQSIDVREGMIFNVTATDKS